MLHFFWACNGMNWIPGGTPQNQISACGKLPCDPASLGSHHVGRGGSNPSVVVAVEDVGHLTDAQREGFGWQRGDECVLRRGASVGAARLAPTAALHQGQSTQCVISVVPFGCATRELQWVLTRFLLQLGISFLRLRLLTPIRWLPPQALDVCLRVHILYLFKVPLHFCFPSSPCIVS